MTSYNIIVHGNNNQFSLVPSVLTPSLFIPVVSEIPRTNLFFRPLLVIAPKVMMVRLS